MTNDRFITHTIEDRNPYDADAKVNTWFRKMDKAWGIKSVISVSSYVKIDDMYGDTHYRVITVEFKQ